MMEEQRGTHFDPKVLDAFFARSEDIVQVQLQYMDPP
jgi:putative two-component system response regulator